MSNKIEVPAFSHDQLDVEYRTIRDYVDRHEVKAEIIDESIESKELTWKKIAIISTGLALFMIVIRLIGQ